MNVRCQKCRFKFNATVPDDGSTIEVVCPRCGERQAVHGEVAPQPVQSVVAQPVRATQPAVAQSVQPAQPAVAQPVQSAQPITPEATVPQPPANQPQPEQPVQQPPVPKQPQVIYVKSQSNSTAWWAAAIVVVLLAGAGAFYLINNHGRQSGSTAPEMSMAQSNDAVTSVDSDDDEPETIDDLRQMIIANPRSHDVIEKWADVLSDVRLTEDDIWGIDSGTLRYLRNAIFAKHNYRFKSDDLMEFYCQYDWYSPDKTNVIAELNSVETYNIEFFKNHE